jgi:DNA-binding NtrC family response regulator/methylmalonyl-CoA mutase cobalamin-binding subunit
MKPTILLTFVGSHDFEHSKCTSLFRDEGFDPIVVTNGEPQQPFAARGADAAVLVLSHFDPAQAEQALGVMRKRVVEGGGNPRHVIVCGRDLIWKDEKELREWGASKVVRPASWEPRPVAERILAALYGGFTTSDGGAETFIEFKGYEKPYMNCEVPYKLTTETRKLIGATQIMRELRTKIRAYSTSPDPILITGDTGTGKELVAAAIHSSNEANKEKAYIPINISELGQEVLPSELFGHVRGAFTGATEKRCGLLEEAGDGTIFIDEIGDLDLPNQARLLRVFENRQIRPVGATYKQRVALNARLIFATHKPLEKMCVEGDFRQDLYQRLKEGHDLDVPVLSKRRGDLELLAKEFFGRWRAERAGCQSETFTLKQSDYDKIVDVCVGHEFGGNVRRLWGVLRACFGNSLIDRRFTIHRLTSELDIEPQQAERSGRGVVEESSTGSRPHSITFDPSAEKYHDFMARTRAEYCTHVYRAAGRDLEEALVVADIKEKTFRTYLPKSELRRSHKRKVLAGGAGTKGGATDED